MTAFLTRLLPPEHPSPGHPLGPLATVRHGPLILCLYNVAKQLAKQSLCKTKGMANDLHNLNWQASNDFSPKNIHFKAVKIYPKFISLSVCVRLSAVSSSSSSESMEGVGLEEEEEEEEVEGLMINLVDISTTTLQEGQTPNMSHSELLEDLYFGCYWSVAGFLRRKVWKKANKSTV